jgi:hypothetical protein
MIKYGLISRVNATLEDNNAGIVFAVRESQVRNIQIFIHELVHINQMHPDYNNDINPYSVYGPAGREIVADMVNLHVIRELFGSDSEYEKDFWEFLNIPEVSNSKERLELVNEYLPKWDLNNKTIKQYINE